nr:hypothetical protein [Moritella viscosa]
MEILIILFIVISLAPTLILGGMTLLRKRFLAHNGINVSYARADVIFERFVEKEYRNKILERNRLSISSNQEQVKELSPLERKIQARANALTLENED